MKFSSCLAEDYIPIARYLNRFITVKWQITAQVAMFQRPVWKCWGISSVHQKINHDYDEHLVAIFKLSGLSTYPWRKYSALEKQIQFFAHEICWSRISCSSIPTSITTCRLPFFTTKPFEVHCIHCFPRIPVFSQNPRISHFHKSNCRRLINQIIVPRFQNKWPWNIFHTPTSTIPVQVQDFVFGGAYASTLNSRDVYE